MKAQKKQSEEFRKFDAIVDKLLTVSRDELQQQEKQYKANQKRKKRAKP